MAINRLKETMNKHRGFSMLELLLLLSVAAIFFALSFSYDTRKVEKLKIDKTILQMQQILNAGLLYYVNTGEWPDYSSTECNKVSLTASTSSLQTVLGYLPTAAMPTVFGVAGNLNYVLLSSSNVSSCSNFPAHSFAVIAYYASGTATAKQTAIARAIAARLPNGYVDSTNNYISAYIHAPGQDPNDATALNFAGLYHQGACVPVPDCPSVPGGVTYTPQIFLTPTSVSGVNDDGSTNVYPISSFSAYASGPASPAPVACGGSTASSPNTPTCPTGVPNAGSGNGNYWRACIQVITERGDVQVTRSDSWGDNVTIAAFTRCTISSAPGEPAGSAFTVYGD